MTEDVLSVESKANYFSRDTWVRMKIGIYKGDLAKVVSVDNVQQRVTVILIPRIDLQALANKLEGRDVHVPKKKAFTPPALLLNIDEARELHVRVERRRDSATCDYFENIDGKMFKDGFLYKSFALRSLSTKNVQFHFYELEKFRQPGESVDGDMSSLYTLFANRKKEGATGMVVSVEGRGEPSLRHNKGTCMPSSFLLQVYICCRFVSVLTMLWKVLK